MVDNYIVYSSDLVIPDRDVLATLCVFYDRVYLPEVAHFIMPMYEKFNLEGFSPIMLWDAKNYDLFQEGILTRLDHEGEQPLVDASKYLRDEHNFQVGPDRWSDLVSKHGVSIITLEEMSERFNKFTPDNSLVDRANSIIGTQHQEAEGRTAYDEVIRVLAMSYHLFRKNVDCAEIFQFHNDHVQREDLITLMAQQTMGYLIPRLSDLKTEEILELRRKVSDTRVGFAFHLQRLTKGLDSRLKGGESPELIAKWARDIVATDLVPDYAEFVAQLTAGQTLGGRIGRTFEISSGVWSLKFWGDLLRAWGVPISYATEQKERLTHRSRTFQFMRAVEESKAAKYQRRSLP